ncbi:polysaccharide deacetylase family protein [Reinekea sp. G2M2-21]|uniref:polysaccharide deacetylase family protein n=1 Tax=Reinekea sp. G2M2-21 TaxID=2788942 RepID=UPI0018A8DC8C|nr:polysaccharide deacetylase family protein [Reinekea sp. G2M2-21]
MLPVRKHSIPIFMLHRPSDPKLGVSGHSQQFISEALNFVKKSGYTAISLRKLVNSAVNGDPLPKMSICFTMDDGFSDQAEKILPIFEEYQVPITFFLATDMLDRQYWSWDFQLDYVISRTSLKQLNAIIAGKPFKSTLGNPTDRRNLIRKVRSHLKTKGIDVSRREVLHIANVLCVDIPKTAPASFTPMSWDQARELESDFVEFGPHSCEHSILTQLDGDQAKREIEHSWQRLKDELTNPTPIFCYPTGREGMDFTERDKILVKNSELTAAVSADPGYANLNSSDLDLYALKRFSFPMNDLTQFKQYCSWIERAKEIITGRI